MTSQEHLNNVKAMAKRTLTKFACRASLSGLPGLGARRSPKPARYALAAACALLLLSRASHGQEVAQPARVLTLDQALSMARKSNRSLAAERERLAQARTSIEQAWSSLFPTVSAQGRYTRNNVGVYFLESTFNPSAPAGAALTIQPLNQLDGSIGFTAPLIAPAAYPALQASKTSTQAAEADYQTSLTNVLYAVAQSYYAAAISDEVIAARQSSLDVARATLQNAETRFSAGTVTKVDVDRAELAVVRAEQALREARLGNEQSYRALSTLIQSSGGYRVEPLAPPRLGEPPRDLEMALRLRPEFRAIGLLASAEHSQQHAYGWRWAPTLAAFGNARVFNYDNFAQQRYAWAVGLELDWLLYDGGVRDAQRHLAEAQVRESLARAQILSDSIRDDLANGQGLLETKRHAQEAALRQLTLAKETLDLVRTQYQAGNVAQIELLQAQDNLVAANEVLAQAHYELAMADLSLRRAAGTFPSP